MFVFNNIREVRKDMLLICGISVIILQYCVNIDEDDGLKLYWLHTRLSKPLILGKGY